MAETGCLRNVAYNHVSVRGNLTSSSKNIKTLKKGSGDVTLTAQDNGIIILGSIGDEFDVSDGFTITMPRLQLRAEILADGSQIGPLYPSNGLIFNFFFAGDSIIPGSEIKIVLNPDDPEPANNKFRGWMTAYVDGTAATLDDQPRKAVSASNANTLTFGAGVVCGDTCQLIGTPGHGWYILAETHVDEAITATSG